MSVEDRPSPVFEGTLPDGEATPRILVESLTVSDGAEDNFDFGNYQAVELSEEEHAKLDEWLEDLDSHIGSLARSVTILGTALNGKSQSEIDRADRIGKGIDEAFKIDGVDSLIESFGLVSLDRAHTGGSAKVKSGSAPVEIAEAQTRTEPSIEPSQPREGPASQDEDRADTAATNWSMSANKLSCRRLESLVAEARNLTEEIGDILDGDHGIDDFDAFFEETEERMTTLEKMRRVIASAMEEHQGGQSSTTSKRASTSGSLGRPQGETAGPSHKRAKSVSFALLDE